MHSIRFLFLTTALAVAASTAKAEYRVFELAINDSSTGTSRTVISTLDDIQYPGYHHLKKTESITIQSSWMCWERSENFKLPCPNPRAPDSTP